MTKAATVHNPTHFEPADYEVQDYFDNRRPEYFGQSVEEWQLEIKDWEAELARAFGANWIRKIHKCVHCGNGRVRWITAVLHIPTKDVVVFGCDCTERLGFANRQDWKLAQLKAKAEAGHARMKVWKQRTAFLEANPEVATYFEAVKQPVHAGNTFVQDVLSKLNQFGSISVNQVNAIKMSLARDIERAAAREAEATEVKGPAPVGRQTVTGKVLTVKVVEGFYGLQVKTLLKLENNSKVWLTLPAAAQGKAERNDTVTITATFEPKTEDPTFAFGKRPTLVNLVKAEGGAQ